MNYKNIDNNTYNDKREEVLNNIEISKFIKNHKAKAKKKKILIISGISLAIISPLIIVPSSVAPFFISNNTIEPFKNISIEIKDDLWYKISTIISDKINSSSIGYEKEKNYYNLKSYFESDNENIIKYISSSMVFKTTDDLILPSNEIIKNLSVYTYDLPPLDLNNEKAIPPILVTINLNSDKYSINPEYLNLLKFSIDNLGSISFSHSEINLNVERNDPLINKLEEISKKFISNLNIDDKKRDYLNLPKNLLGSEEFNLNLKSLFTFKNQQGFLLDFDEVVNYVEISVSDWPNKILRGSLIPPVKIEIFTNYKVSSINKQKLVFELKNLGELPIYMDYMIYSQENNVWDIQSLNDRIVEIVQNTINSSNGSLNEVKENYKKLEGLHNEGNLFSLLNQSYMFIPTTISNLHNTSNLFDNKFIFDDIAYKNFIQSVNIKIKEWDIVEGRRNIIPGMDIAIELPNGYFFEESNIFSTIDISSIDLLKVLGLTNVINFQEFLKNDFFNWSNYSAKYDFYNTFFDNKKYTINSTGYYPPKIFNLILNSFEIEFNGDRNFIRKIIDSITVNITDKFPESNEIGKEIPPIRFTINLKPGYYIIDSSLLTFDIKTNCFI